MGVNDLAQQWAEDQETNGGYAAGYIEGQQTCAAGLQQVARTSWHPVTEPPTEADGDDGVVLAFAWDANGMLMMDCAEWWELPAWATHWARIRDIVLLPEGSGE